MILRKVRTAEWYLRASLALLFARSSSRSRLAAASPRRLLVVCYGNIYRSAFAGQSLLLQLPPQLEVRSAGFHGVPGRSSPDRHVAMSWMHGVDLTQHRSRVIGVEDIRWAEIVVLMDRKNWIQLRRMGVPSDALVWLGAFSSGPVEIEDPYKMGDAAAARLLDRLDACVRGLAADLKRLLSSQEKGIKTQ